MTQRKMQNIEKAMPKRSVPEKSGYHHGDLRQSLIDAALHLVETHGADACTLKEASKIAGVSVAAPYRHFPDKAALLMEVASRGFRALRVVTVEARDQYPKGAIEGLIAMGEQYIQFAEDNPHLFRLMFNSEGEYSSEMIRQAKEMSAIEGDESRTGFDAFMHTVTNVIYAYGGSQEDLMDMAMPLWSCVHGAACLVINDSFERMAPGTDMDDMVDTATRFMFDGLKKRLAHRAESLH